MRTMREIDFPLKQFANYLYHVALWRLIAGMRMRAGPKHRKVMEAEPGGRFFECSQQTSSLQFSKARSSSE